MFCFLSLRIFSYTSLISYSYSEFLSIVTFNIVLASSSYYLECSYICLSCLNFSLLSTRTFLNSSSNMSMFSLKSLSFYCWSFSYFCLSSCSYFSCCCWSSCFSFFLSKFISWSFLSYLYSHSLVSSKSS